jgi:hypothetical protein
VLQVEDGKQGVIRPDVVAVKQSLDPAGLLNPGKLRGWALRDQLELDSNPLARATAKAPRPDRPAPVRANRSARFFLPARRVFYATHSYE